MVARAVPVRETKDGRWKDPEGEFQVSSVQLGKRLAGTLAPPWTLDFENEDENEDEEDWGSVDG